MDLWYTPDEPWHPAKGVYAIAKDWACTILGPGHRRSCLVIGSPLEEARMLCSLGWRVTYLDWRLPPLPLHDMLICVEDVCNMMMSNSAFDAISSTCVLCHVGMGRYGDPVREHAPLRMLQECARVLVPGGQLVAMAGPVDVSHHPTPRILPQHRVTSHEEMRTWCEQAGFTWRSSMETATDAAGERYLCFECVK